MSHALGKALERDMERKKGDPESPPGEGAGHTQAQVHQEWGNAKGQGFVPNRSGKASLG